MRFLAHEELREGQREMISDGINALKENGFLLANAPTGIGKTAAALSAALTISRSRIGQKNPVLFMTGRQTQHRIVVDTVRKINQRLNPNEEKIRLVDMIGQKDMCIHPHASEHDIGFSRLCANLRSKRKCKPFLEDSPGLRLRVLQDPLHVDELVNISKTHQEGHIVQPTCPWKVARECASSADVVVCDYNHLFNENVRDSSLKAMGLNMDEMILVLDEAHNLPERIRMGLRRRLTADLIRDAVFELEEHRESGLNSEETVQNRTCEAALKRYRMRIVQWIKDQKSNLGKAQGRQDEQEMRVEPSLILSMLRQEFEGDISGEKIAFSELIALLESVNAISNEDEDETACYRLATVLSILSRFEKSSALCVVLTARRDSVWITTHLLDPAIIGKEIFNSVRGGILMSGTLTPPRMYAENLGIDEERGILAADYPSPFMADRRPVIITSDVSTLWGRRGEENTRMIRNHLHSLLQNTPGHVAIFCPSYAMLKEIIGEGNWPGRLLLMEESNWSKKRVEGAISEMRGARIRGTKVILAGVYGGRLSEGLDYSGNLLDAVACIGIPNAPKSVQNDSLKKYIEKQSGSNNAWRYGVFQPAINRILQAMGRAIRKAEDRAFILLLDDRLLKPNYKKCLPPTFTPFTASDPSRTARQVKRFFERHPEPAIDEN